MAINLTADFVFLPGRRLVIAKARSNDEEQLLLIDAELRTSSATEQVISKRIVEVRNGPGQSDRLRRNPSLAAGQPFSRWLLVDDKVLLLPTGYTDAMAAMRAAANTPSARRAALETWCLSSGVFDSSLSGA
jgi:hypothetical protein